MHLKLMNSLPSPRTPLAMRAQPLGGEQKGVQKPAGLTYSRPNGRAKKKFWLVKHEKNPAWDCPIHCSSERQQLLMSIRHAAEI